MDDPDEHQHIEQPGTSSYEERQERKQPHLLTSNNPIDEHADTIEHSEHKLLQQTHMARQTPPRQISSSTIDTVVDFNTPTKSTNNVIDEEHTFVENKSNNEHDSDLDSKTITCPSSGKPLVRNETNMIIKEQNDQKNKNDHNDENDQTYQNNKTSSPQLTNPTFGACELNSTITPRKVPTKESLSTAEPPLCVTKFCQDISLDLTKKSSTASNDKVHTTNQPNESLPNFLTNKEKHDVSEPSLTPEVNQRSLIDEQRSSSDVQAIKEEPQEDIKVSV